ncbi:MAG TPA: outer membrane beta-barrel protein [Thermoanaerobaculia bacterium]|nr:outer membrane beta-barrel protein [Thermoanaerobaculia bacterium]
MFQPDRRTPRLSRFLFVASVLTATGAGAQEPPTTPAAPAAPAAERPFELYGWIQQGFTADFDAPDDRVNFGVNFNWRSNDYRLNQLYGVLENTLEHEGRFNVAYRVDAAVGHDAPWLAANGLFDHVTGLDPTSGVGQEGAPSYRNVNRIGFDLPQFYVDFGVPHFITSGGVDIRAGKFYTLMGREVYPAADTDFYSRTYENIFATPFTHTGVLATIHATGNLDVVAGLVRGWDVFEDNNGRPSWQAALIWNSTDRRFNWTTVGITGPEQVDNDENVRTLVTSYVTLKFGPEDEWLLSTGGHVGHEENAVSNPVTGAPQGAEWYACAVHLFYTVDPRVRLQFRGEWFRDDDAARTAVLKRPGFAASFYDVTVGFTYRLRENIRVRPEARYDWTPDARPFDDQTKKSQFTTAFDVIWQF